MEEEVIDRLIRLSRVQAIMRKEASISLIPALLLSFTGSTDVKYLDRIPRDGGSALVQALPSFYLTKLRLQGRRVLVTTFDKDPAVTREDVYKTIERACSILPSLNKV
jgi:hypothetical protein